MAFANLNIESVIIHEVFKRDDNRAIVAPVFGTSLVALDADGVQALQDRIISALASDAHCMEMAIYNHQPGSVFAISANLMGATQSAFITQSQALANALAVAQTSRQLPGGIVVVFKGTIGFPALPILGVIKAEVHNGFTREQESNGRLDLKFLKNLLLTPQTKLYKIGLFVQYDATQASPTNICGGYQAYVYDDAMKRHDRQSAAHYFYDTFLGCSFLPSSSLLTRDFHTHTKKFISGLQVPEEQKMDLYTGLYTYLKVDQSPTVETSVFAQSYFVDDDVKAAYMQFMEDNNVPPVAIHKDLSDLASELKLRRVNFAAGVKLTAPAEKFEEMIKLSTGLSEPDPITHQQSPVTIVTIKGKIVGQE